MLSGRWCWDAFPMAAMMLALPMQSIQQQLEKGKNPIRPLRRQDEVVEQEAQQLLDRYKQWDQKDHVFVHACREMMTKPHIREAMRIVYHRFETMRPFMRLMTNSIELAF